MTISPHTSPYPEQTAHHRQTNCGADHGTMTTVGSSHAAAQELTSFSVITS